MVKPRHVIRGVFFGVLLPAFLAASVSVAYGQSFTLTTTALYPTSVDPGGSATATINLGATDGFDDSVALTCTVASGPATTSEPVCTPSPTSQVPPAKPALTITTSNGTTAGTYQFTVTGTSGSITQTATLYLGVADIAENYALSVLPTTATPGSIPPGQTATTTVTVSPLGTYSGHMITLSCLSVTPIVTAAPTCSFDPPTVMVASSGVVTSVMTITSYGAAATTTTTTERRNRRIFYALSLLVPGLALAGIGASGGRKRNALGVLLLMAIASGFLLMPACNGTNLTSQTTSTLNGAETPKNNYIFTLTGADENGAAPSTTTPTTVMVAVN
ncbi:MAG: hypothetical protein ABSA78_03500 [Candidatus Sulfotelmatobacter sp.]|jgi:hypothetical protein